MRSDKKRCESCLFVVVCMFSFGRGGKPRILHSHDKTLRNVHKYIYNLIHIQCGTCTNMRKHVTNL